MSKSFETLPQEKLSRFTFLRVNFIYKYLFSSIFQRFTLQGVNENCTTFNENLFILYKITTNEINNINYRIKTKEFFQKFFNEI